MVTGKGGVGKTTLTAALTRVAASSGKSVLVCEADRSGGLCRALGVSALAADPARLPGGPRNLSALAIDTESALREYIRLYLKVPIVTRLTPIAHALDFVAQAAPGVREILTIGKICHEVRTGGFDLVIVDAPSSGHVVSLLTAARTIHDAVPAGPLRGQTRWMLDILDDEAQTGVVVVTTPEELPISETAELVAQLDAENGPKVAAVVVNRLVPEPFTKTDAATFSSLKAAPPKGADRVFAAAELLLTIRQRAVENLANLPVGPDRIVLPEVATSDTGDMAATVEALREHLAGELL